MPFHGYEEKNDPFAVTRFVPHEMLHTFGYHHSDEMYHLQKLVNAEFSRYRWFMVDHPEVAPVIVQGFRADAVEKKPVVKKKEGTKRSHRSRGESSSHQNTTTNQGTLVMDLIDHLREIAAKIPKIREHLKTKEATKTPSSCPSSRTWLQRLRSYRGLPRIRGRRGDEEGREG